MYFLSSRDIIVGHIQEWMQSCPTKRTENARPPPSLDLGTAQLGYLAVVSLTVLCYTGGRIARQQGSTVDTEARYAGRGSFFLAAKAGQSIRDRFRHGVNGHVLERTALILGEEEDARNSNETATFLARVPLFRSLNRGQLEGLAKSLVPRDYTRRPRNRDPGQGRHRSVYRRIWQGRGYSHAWGRNQGQW